MSVTVETAIDPATGEHFRCVFDAKTCLPVEPIQRFLNYCRKRGLATNTVETYAYRLVDYWRWLEYKALRWNAVGLDELADFVNWYLLGGDVAVIHESFRERVSKRSPKTVNQAMTAIQGLYEFHAAEGRINDLSSLLTAGASGAASCGASSRAGQSGVSKSSSKNPRSSLVA